MSAGEGPAVGDAADEVPAVGQQSPSVPRASRRRRAPLLGQARRAAHRRRAAAPSLAEEVRREPDVVRSWSPGRVQPQA